MCSRRIIKIIIVFPFFCIAGFSLLLGAEGFGTTGAQILSINTSARLVSMGSAGVGVADSLDAIVYNPAGLTQVEGHQFQLSHIFYFLGTSLNSVTYAGRFHKLGYGIKWKYFYAEDSIRSVAGLKEKGLKIQYMQYSGGLGYPLSRKSSFGMTVNAVTEQVYNEAGSVVGCDLGWQYRFYKVEDDSKYQGISAALLRMGDNYRKYSKYIEKRRARRRSRRGMSGNRERINTIGVSIKNIGGKIKTGSASYLPLKLSVGGAHELPIKYNLMMVWEVSSSRETDFVFQGGVEAEIEGFKARAGFTCVTKPDFAFGFGVPEGIWRFDYAFFWHRDLALVHRFTIGVGF